MVKLQRFLINCIAVLGGIIFLFLTFYSWCYTKEVGKWEIITTNRDTILAHTVSLVIALVLAAIFIKVCKNIPEKGIHLAAIGVSVVMTVIMTIAVHSVSYYTEADQYYVYEAARQMAEGCFDIDMMYSYFRIYPYQLGLVKFYAFFFEISKGNGYEVIQTVNALCVGLSNYAGYRITKDLFKTKEAQLLYLICTICFVPLCLYAFFIYGESMGTCGALLAVWGFLGYNRTEGKRTVKIGYWVLAAVALAITYIVRGALIIVWIAMAIIQVLLFLQEKRWKVLVATLALAVVTVGSSTLLLKQVERSQDVQLNQGMPMILCMTMGLQEHPEPGKGQGSYNNYDWELYQQCGLDESMAVPVAKKDIAQRLRYWSDNPGAAVTFFKEKLLNQWIDPTFNVFVMTDTFRERPEWVADIYKEESKQGITVFLNEYQAVGYLALFGYFVWIIAKKRNPKECLPGLILVGEFLFSAIWEAKGRYVYPYAVLAIPCMAGGLAVYGIYLISILNKIYNKLLHKNI